MQLLSSAEFYLLLSVPSSLSVQRKYLKSNFSAIVPKELKKESVAIAVFQTGSIEITDIDVKKAMMDPVKDIKQYEKQWTEKEERASEKLFDIAIKATEENQGLNVVILKRMPRFDLKSEDPLFIKSKLSIFANNVYDKLWLKNGCPTNIRIATLNLGCSDSEHLRTIIVGNPDSQSFNGIHLHGAHASRHFTYRAVQAIKSAIAYSYADSCTRNKLGASFPQSENHINCPQARYQGQSPANHGKGNMSQAQNYNNSVPTKNSFNILGNC